MSLPLLITFSADPGCKSIPLFYFCPLLGWRVHFVGIVQVVGIVNSPTDCVEKKRKIEGWKFSWPAQACVLWPICLSSCICDCPLKSSIILAIQGWIGHIPVGNYLVLLKWECQQACKYAVMTESAFEQVLIDFYLLQENYEFVCRSYPLACTTEKNQSHGVIYGVTSYQWYFPPFEHCEQSFGTAKFVRFGWEFYFKRLLGNIIK